jgi:hypothetical protein
MKQFLSYSRWAKDIYYSLYFQRTNSRGETPFIVYQMGKVGSKGVSLSLESIPQRVPVYHVHRLTDQGLKMVANKTSNRLNILTGERVPNIQFYEGRYLRDQLATRFQDRQVYVISLVRDPIARCISGFFFSGKDSIVKDFDQLRNKHSDDAMIDIMRDLYLNEYSHHHVPETWFDDEMKVIFELDVFETPFDKLRGWQLYENPRVRLLLIRLENLNDVWQEAFSAMQTGFDTPALIRANDNQEGPNGTLYRRFLKEPALPEAYLDRMYQTRFAQHFYTPDEIDGFRARWRAQRGG